MYLVNGILRWKSVCLSVNTFPIVCLNVTVLKEKFFFSTYSLCTIPRKTVRCHGRTLEEEPESLRSHCSLLLKICDRGYSSKLHKFQFPHLQNDCERTGLQDQICVFKNMCVWWYHGRYRKEYEYDISLNIHDYGSNDDRLDGMEKRWKNRES